jgi:spore coat protein CotH
MHEIVANELFTDFGLVGANSSFYELYLNVDGSKNTANDIYYGLYTLVEEIDDTVIKTQYGDDEGNIYKPEDDAATFAAGTYNEAEYDWKNYDDDIQDKYADIEALYNLINDSSRTTSPAVWKSNLEAIFNVNIFLKWLAANNVMQNWDTYGVMSHNYYLYNNPATGLFDWIQWDNNEALTFNPRCLPLNLSTVTFDWPLIRYILDIDEYEATYKTEVVNFSNSYFNGASSTRFSVNDRYEGDEREF